MPTDFSEFDWDLAVFTNRRHLPHLEQDGGIHFTTFRLADSLPWEKVRLWKYERDQWLLANPPPHTGEQLRVLCQLVPQRVHKYLDAGHGACLLCHSSAQDIVEQVLRFGDCTTYRLGNFVIMPNHVHALVQPITGRFKDIAQAWKSISSRRINKSLGRHGQLWQEEPFSHILRSHQRLEAARQYIRDNPKYLPPGTYRLGCGSLA